MASVQELYELWAGDSALDQELEKSLAPRSVDLLFDLFAELEPKAGDLVVDVGCRDATHAIRLVREHRVRCLAVDPLSVHVDLARQRVAEAALGDEIEVAQASIESLPLNDAAADLIWCRDVLVHVDVARGLGECARALRPGGRMIAYLTLASELLEPRERDALVDALALAPKSFDANSVEGAASGAGLTSVAVHEIGSEWRERMIEDGSWDVSGTLLQLSRLRRRSDELRDRFGAAAVAAYAADHVWGVYQLLGKLIPTIYVWERRA